MSVVRVQKRQLEKAKQEKAAAKRERRQSREPLGEASGEAVGAPEHAQDKVLADLAALHQRYADEQLSLEDFEEQRAEMVSRLRVD